MKKLFAKKVIFAIALMGIVWIDADLQNVLETIIVKKANVYQFPNNVKSTQIVKLVFIVQQKDNVLINVKLKIIANKDKLVKLEYVVLL